MPGWTGWNEDQVRRRSLHTVPVMTGFTPINAPAPTATADLSKADGLGSTQNTDSLNVSNSIASEYLGRGETETSTDTPELATPKQQVSKGKKRLNTANTASKTKCKKISNVSSGRTTAKPAVRGYAQANAAKDSATQAPPKSSKKHRITADQNTAADSTPKIKRARHQKDASPCQPAVEAAAHPVYSQQTSMDTVNRSTQPTSMDALRSSSGCSATLYAGVENARLQQPGIEFAQPWLNNAMAPPKAQRRSSAARTPLLSPVEKEDDFDVLFDRLTQGLGAGDSTRTQSTSPKAVQLPTPITSDEASQLPEVRKQPSRKVKRAIRAPTIQTDEDFIVSDDSDAEALADAAEAVEERVARRSLTPPPRERKLNTREVASNEDYGGAILSEAERKLLDKLRVNSQDAIKPIVRQPFPQPVLDRSPIFGASNSTLLRTCFRIGEAMNVGCQAVRMNRNVLLELYGRVIHSTRQGRSQHFVFHDLYHDKPPHLTGTYDLWDQSRLWGLNSKAFLVPREGGVMCRAMARMKRDGQKWKLEIFTIWEASWQDVEYVAGIYSKRSEQLDEEE